MSADHELLFLIGLVVICFFSLGILWLSESNHIQRIMDEERLYKRIHEQPTYTWRKRIEKTFPPVNDGPNIPYPPKKAKPTDTSYRVRDSTRNKPSD